LKKQSIKSLKPKAAIAAEPHFAKTSQAYEAEILKAANIEEYLETQELSFKEEQEVVGKELARIRCGFDSVREAGEERVLDRIYKHVMTDLYVNKDHIGSILRKAE